LEKAEWSFALRSLAVKVAVFGLAELVLCEWDPERRVCDVVEKGFLSCLITYALRIFW